MPLLHSNSRYLAPFTLPSFILSSPYLSTLFPIAMGSTIGFSVSPPLNPHQSAAQYHSLRRPPLHPPAWAFGPVWTTLYGIMGYASHRVYAIGLNSLSTAVRDSATKGTTLYGMSLVLNFIWMPLFFRLNLPRLALADILLLSANVAAVTVSYFKVDHLAGYLMMPYMAWLGFATYLCAGVGYLNGWDVSGVRRKTK
ncbi:TspO/MBR family-domain-containing protein [Kalaharituber pfeilii]|nr:TspO/MBR family-domain-containing protein [Kalaharituber pfeilii]